VYLLVIMTTTFIWPYEANTVSIIGDFNDWQPEPLSRTKDGSFQISKTLPEGEYQYKFLIDGRRYCYDILKETDVNDRGDRNNIVTVGGAGKKGKAQQQGKGGEQLHGKGGEQHQGKGGEQHQGKGKGKGQQQQEQQRQQDKGGEQHQGKGKGKGQQQDKGPQEEQKEQQAKGGEQQQGKGKGKGQQQQQAKKKNEDGEEEEESSVVVKKEADKVITAITSYQQNLYVAHVLCGDSLEAVLSVEKQVRAALPDVSVMILSAEVKNVIIVASVPEAKTSELSALDWVNEAVQVVKGVKAEGDERFAQAIINANPDEGIFALKVKDAASGLVFPWLRKKGLLKKEEDSDDEMFFLDE